MPLFIVMLIISLYVVLEVIESFTKKINWTIVIPIIIVIITICILLYLKKKKEKKNAVTEQSSTIELLDENAPIELTGVYKCNSCGGVTQIVKTDRIYFCKFCGSALLDAAKDAEQIRIERKAENAERKKLIDKQHEIELKNMEIRQEQLRMKAKRARIRSVIFNILIIIIPLALFALVIIISNSVITEFWHGLWDSVFKR